MPVDYWFSLLEKLSEASATEQPFDDETLIFTAATFANEIRVFPPALEIELDPISRNLTIEKCFPFIVEESLVS